MCGIDRKGKFTWLVTPHHRTAQTNRKQSSGSTALHAAHDFIHRSVAAATVQHIFCSVGLSFSEFVLFWNSLKVWGWLTVYLNPPQETGSLLGVLDLFWWADVPPGCSAANLRHLQLHICDSSGPWTVSVQYGGTFNSFRLLNTSGIWTKQDDQSRRSRLLPQAQWRRSAC